MTEQKRPKPRSKRLTIRIDQETLDLAKDKLEKSNKDSDKERSLSGILRAFLRLWSEEEYPDPPILPGEHTRAKKQPKK